MLEVNKERIEQTTTGDLRRGRRTWVYGREREPAAAAGPHPRARCKGPRGKERAVYWCPACQV